MDNLDDPRLNFNYRTRERGTVPMDEKRDRFQWVSEVAYKNVRRIVARGYDTTELVEQGYGLTDVLFIDFQSRIPLLEEDKMLNYVMVCMLEDGLSSPANISRIVASGKTLLTQAAGSSILAFGHAYGAYQEIGKTMDGILARQGKEGKPLSAVVEAVVVPFPESDVESGGSSGEAEEAVRALVAVSSPDVQREACITLGKLSSEAAVPDLCRILRRKGFLGIFGGASPVVRAAAAWALGQIRDQRALPHLRKAASDRNAVVHSSAKLALQSFET